MNTVINQTQNIFCLTENDNLSEIEEIFFYEIIKPENDKWLLSHFSSDLDEAEKLHYLSESIRLDIVEQYQEEINGLFNPAYKEILQYVIASTDCFKIAKELYWQFKGEHSKKSFIASL